MVGVPLISVVDDDESVRESLHRLIRSAGFAVKVFASAEAFLNSDYLRDTSCLILDARMPGINGLELQRTLVSAAFEIPIIFITAHGDETARSQAIKEGAMDYLHKPFSEDALLNAINVALARDDAPFARIETARKR